MTDPQTPATEAGRRLLARMQRFGYFTESIGADILAIEAEARALGDEYKEATDAAMNYGQGRADALREAADAVRAHAHRLVNGEPHIRVAAVLAILDPQP